MPQLNPRQLIVEGYEDQNAIAHLMGHYVNWPENWRQAPVHIEIGKSISEILDKNYISLKLKQSGLQAIGIVIDADDNPQGRWISLQTILKDTFADIPDLPHEGGYICENDDGLRLGLWLMPDNRSAGMLETFLRHLVPESAADLWNYANNSIKVARRKGATCRDAHLAKAAIHTYLSWQDPPGEKFGIAITKRVLDPSAEAAKPFVAWFKELYQLESISSDR